MDSSGNHWSRARLVVVGAQEIVRVFEVDEGLAGALPADARDVATKHGLARVRSLSPGLWDVHGNGLVESGLLGLLVLDGLIVHDVRVGSTTCTELIGRGDVLRPWEENRDPSSVPLQPEWRVLMPARLAVLDRRFAVVAGHFPDVMDELLSRSVTRARGVVAIMSISHLSGIENRIEACLWHLADRFGRVTPEGVLVPLPLTHLTLARLVGAHRPSVTTALGTLAAQGRVVRQPGGAYLLPGEPPSTAAMQDLPAPGADAPA
jgi:CRP/FNR family transcriptional regulator, cyclic AMP receptor protein